MKLPEIAGQVEVMDNIKRLNRLQNIQMLTGVRQEICTTGREEALNYKEW